MGTIKTKDGTEIYYPIGAAGRASAKLVKSSTLKVYPGAPHGITDTHKDQLNADLLELVRS